MSDVYWTRHTHVHYIHKVTLYTANIACLLAVLALANTANIWVTFSTQPDKEDRKVLPAWDTFICGSLVATSFWIWQSRLSKPDLVITCDSNDHNLWGKQLTQGWCRLLICLLLSRTSKRKKVFSYVHITEMMQYPLICLHGQYGWCKSCERTQAVELPHC